MARFWLFLVAVILTDSTRSEDLYYFTKHPEPTIVTLNSAVQLQCEVSHTTDIVYHWTVNDTRIEETPRISLNNGKDLSIRRVLSADAGEYSCIAENATSGYSLTSRSALLKVIWIGDASVHLESPLTEDAITTGGDVILKCAASGSGEIKFEWTRNELPLFKTDRTQFKNQKSLLQIQNVDHTDNGVYRCTAHGEAGSSESYSEVVVNINNPNGLLNVRNFPRSTFVRKGEPVAFHCSFESAEVVLWKFNNSQINNSSKRIVYSNGTLFIPKVRPSDVGSYSCVGSSNSEEEISVYSATLTLTYLDELTADSFEPRLLAPNKAVLPIGLKHVLTCIPPLGTPRPKIYWTDGLKNEKVPLAGAVYQHDNQLIFESASLENDHLKYYTCVAENSIDYKKFTIQILVSVPPKALGSEQPAVHLNEGDELKLKCPYKGSPSPTTELKWLKSGIIVANKERVENLADGSLVISSVQPSDRGTYVCEIHTVGFPPVSNPRIIVNIKEKLKFVPKLFSKNLEMFTYSKIHCKVSGWPIPTVRWVKGSKDNIQLMSKNVKDINGTLVFQNGSKEDRGKYTCIARNEYETIDTTIDVNLVVMPMFTILPENQTDVLEGHSAIVHCMATGDPRPTINWDKDGTMNGLDNSRFRILENGTLLVSKIYYTDEGVYGCTAGNSAGFKRVETFLAVRGFDAADESDDDEPMMTKTVIITISAAVGYMVLVIGLMAYCRFRRRKRKQAFLRDNPEGILLTKTENGDLNGPISDGEGKKSLNGDDRHADGAEVAHSQSSTQSKRSGRIANYDKLAYPRQNLRDLKLVGHGEFGQVLVGRADNFKYPILVKSLQNTRDEGILAEYRRQIDMYHRLQHENITRLIGLCRLTDPHFLIFEHTDWGNLQQFLQSTRKERGKLTLRQIVDLARQVSLGMEHMSNARFVHRDLAARNCLINSEMQLKITHFSLTKDLHSSDYVNYRNQILPVRWLPAETVFEDEYSTKSDIYSFAVLCWELFHQGDRPFPQWTDRQVIEKLERREVFVKPSKSAPKIMAALLTTCAAISPAERPTFTNVAIVLGEVLNDL